jgi:hypothetical protein
VAKTSSAMKMAYFYLDEKIISNKSASDTFLIIGNFMRSLGLYYALRTSE